MKGEPGARGSEWLARLEEEIAEGRRELMGMLG